MRKAPIVVLLAIQCGLVACLPCQFIKTDHQVNKLPDYPGLQAYLELDELLKREVSDDSEEEAN